MTLKNIYNELVSQKVSTIDVWQGSIYTSQKQSPRGCSMKKVFLDLAKVADLNKVADLKEKQVLEHGKNEEWLFFA